MTGSRDERAEPLTFAGTRVKPGKRKRVDLEVSRLPIGMGNVAIPVMVLRGRRPGPAVWLTAAIHGDEVNGVEVVRRVVERLEPKRMAGTVYAVPILNVFGFMEQTRELPDGRDLNRSFPGSPRGSLAARLADLLMTHVVSGCDVGLDLHTAGGHRENLAQVRGDLEDPATLALAEVFGAPAMVHARARDGSLREAAAQRGVRTLVYEAGEAHRFDDAAIGVGVEGTLRVLDHLGMTDGLSRPPATPSVHVATTRWVRARRSGIVRVAARLGQWVEEGDVLAQLGDPFGRRPVEVRAPFAGLVLGRTRAPLAHQGDALVNLGRKEAS